MDACEATVIGKDHVNAYFLGWGQESVPAMLRLLQFPPKFMLNSEDQPDLSDLGLHQATLNTIQKVNKAMLNQNIVKLQKNCYLLSMCAINYIHNLPSLQT